MKKNIVVEKIQWLRGSIKVNVEKVASSRKVNLEKNEMKMSYQNKKYTDFVKKLLHRELRIFRLQIFY